MTNKMEKIKAVWQDDMSSKTIGQLDQLIQALLQDTNLRNIHGYHLTLYKSTAIDLYQQHLPKIVRIPIPTHLDISFTTVPRIDRLKAINQVKQIMKENDLSKDDIK